MNLGNVGQVSKEAEERYPVDPCLVSVPFRVLFSAHGGEHSRPKPELEFSLSFEIDRFCPDMHLGNDLCCVGISHSSSRLHRRTQK